MSRNVKKVAVIAHAGKVLGGGLSELRDVLEAEGFPMPLWFEVAKSKQAPKCARQALAEGADVIFVWGGDGTVQQCIDAVAGTDAVLAILPAGTANLLANNLDIPTDLKAAVEIGLRGERHAFDTGTINGEHFAVMGGAGTDALMIRAADAGLKDRIGRAAYLWTGARNLRARPVKATIDIEGRRFFDGMVSCVLIANVSKVLGGIEAFPGARPDDALLEIGIITARTRLQWVRTLVSLLMGRTDASHFVESARGTAMKIRFSRDMPYELDGGVRPETDRLRIKVRPASITICVPQVTAGAAAVDSPLVAAAASAKQ